MAANSGNQAQFPLPLPKLELLVAPFWDDYELIDSGNGQKLERFGSYRLIRPETQAIWSPALPASDWDNVDAVFRRTRGDEGSGEWHQYRSLPEQWVLHYENLAFWVRLTAFRHTGIFPEHSAHWMWMRRQLALCKQQPRVLALFGYTGLTSLFAARLGAYVCHIDASRPAVRWAQENQSISHLHEHPIRWIVDDVLKFVKREIRRGNKYDMIIMDPPIFGRGPKGEIWRLHEALPELLDLVVRLLSNHPVGVLVNAYATNLSALSLHNVLSSAMKEFQGNVAAGELVIVDAYRAHPLPTALYARWSQV